MLEIKNLHKSFDGLKAVDDFSLSVQPCKITSLIGPNGAGKTTVFNIVSGYLAPDRGRVVFQNVPITEKAPFHIARMGIARTFQSLRLFRRLTVLENVMLAMQHQSAESAWNALFLFSERSKEHLAHTERAMEFIDFVGLKDRKSDLAENLSYGQQKLLTIACCLAMEPKLLMLDEPVSGVQPVMIERIAAILKELVEKQETTVFLIEHDMDFVLKISDTVVVMDEGKIITEGTPATVKNNPEILEAYLS